ncbi:MAG: cytochrome c [Sandaracinaceae bacterium]
MRRFAPIAFCLACLTLSACGDEPRNLREWTPADHAQPSQPDPARTPSTDESPEMTIARAAATLFNRSCASCHGTDGRGGGPGAPPGAQMPDLTVPAWHDGNTDADITAVISNGRNMMPAFGEQLNDRGIAALVQHVRTLRAN